jgi:hypothetical protein
MLIRVATTRAEIPRVGEGIAFIHGEIQPKISAIDGNQGFAMAVDHSSKRYVGIAAWTDSEALYGSESNASGLIADLARHLHGSKPSVEVFDLVLAHVVKPVRVGYWGRLARLEVPDRDFSRAVQKFQEIVLALFERYDERYEGLAAILLFVDRTSGLLGSIIWYDTLRALRGSAARAQELQELLEAELPTVRFVELSELELVIAETQRLY